MAVDDAVQAHRQDDWRGNAFKVKKVRNAIKAVIEVFQSKQWATGDAGSVGPGNEAASTYLGQNPTDVVADKVLELVKNQHEY